SWMLGCWVALAAVPAVAQGPDGPPPGGPPFPGRGPGGPPPFPPGGPMMRGEIPLAHVPLSVLRAALKLTERQAEQVEQIVQKARKDRQSFMGRMGQRGLGRPGGPGGPDGPPPPGVGPDG